MSIVGAGILVLSVSPSASYAADVFCNADPNCIVATAAGPGALPGATDPNALINDPAQTEAKVSLAASN